MNLRRFTRKSIYHALSPYKARRKIDRSFGVFLIVLIFLNVIATVLETVASVQVKYETFFIYFEIVSVFIFLIEYCFRVWVSVELDTTRKMVTRLKYMCTPLAIIDLLAIVPFFLPLFITVDLRFIRVLRIMRILRVFKLSRYFKSASVLASVIKAKLPELVIANGIGLALLVFSSSAMYLFECEAQPEVFSSIPAAMWWAVATLTTVGYGDVYPVTVGGKIFGSIVALLGVGLVALPTSILGAGLVDKLNQDRMVATQKCPHCLAKLKQESKKAS